MDDSFFNKVKVKEIEVSGTNMRFPLRYYDWSMIAACFPAPAVQIQKILPGSHLKSVQLAPGIAAVHVMAFEFRQIDTLAPYNELAIMIPVDYQPKRNGSALPGAYAYYLPVSTVESCRVGNEVWGFPKVLADVSFDNTDGMCYCRVSSEGKEVISLQVKTLVTAPKAWESYYYTVKDGSLLRTRIQIEGKNGEAVTDGGASFTLGPHSFADKLSVLGMQTTSIGHWYAPQVKSILHLPDARLQL